MGFYENEPPTSGRPDVRPVSQKPKQAEPLKPIIVCLCGSTRFMQQFFEVGWEKTLLGEIVLSVGVCKHADDHGAEALGPRVVQVLDRLHLRKIDLADYVSVLNVDDYIGKSTAREILYAYSQNKPVEYLTAPSQTLATIRQLADAAEAECPVWNWRKDA